MALKLHARTTAALTAAIALLAAPAVTLGSPAAAATGAPSFQLNDVACVNPSFCIAVGATALRSASGLDGSTRPLIERWNGKKWTIVASPGGKGATLRGVTCRSTTFCIAVGLRSATGPGDGKTLALRWNGTAWTVLATPNPSDASGSSFAKLNDISCSSTTNCKAVGFYTTGDGRAPTLAEHWNGTKWTIVASPNLSEGGTGEWLGVACPSATMCMAVGQDGLGLINRPNLETARWNGTKWTLLPTPPPAKAYTGLAAVACLSPTNCWAVGWSLTGSVFQPNPTKTLVEHWNGTKWVIVPSSVGGTTASQLYGITCKSATNCIAVGSYAVPSDATGRQRTLVLRWNGTKWSKVASPNPVGATGTVLAAVSCVVPSNCTAVGRSTTSTFERPLDAGPFTTLIEKWNGTKWSIAASPKPPTPTP